jgi:hypothetical protein
MKYKVENNQNDKILIMTEDEWRRLVHACASQENYGMFRHWEHDGVKYFDCGAKTFKITAIK